MANDLTGAPKRSTNLAEYDPRALDLGQELAGYKNRLDAATLDLESAQREITRLEISLQNRDEQIARLDTRLTQSLMRNAEQATHLIQLKKIVDTAVGGLAQTAQIAEEHTAETAQIAEERRQH